MCTNEDGTHDPKAVARYYCSDLYDRQLALDMCEEHWIEGTINAICGSWDGEPAQQGIREAITWHGENIRVLDHGFGHLEHTLGFMVENIKASYFVVDYWSPVRSFIVEMVRKYIKDAHIFPIWVYPDTPAQYEQYKPFHFIHSAEVMEHIPHPEVELARLASCMPNGALLTMSTFFNSMDGHDPQHLTENDQYQESELWFNEIKKTGLELYACDPRGVEKIWQKKGNE